MKPRTRARSVSLQALYEIDLVGHPPGLVLQERIEEASLDPTLARFTRQIVLNIWPLIEILDRFIAEHAPEWPLDQVATIDRNILRIALWEFAVFKKTPIKVAINEAVELAKVFGSDSTPRFVNGVLGSLASRQNEIQQALQRLIEAGNLHFEDEIQEIESELSEPDHLLEDNEDEAEDYLSDIDLPEK